MKYTAQDFAQAEFVRHRNGVKAMRRTGVSTDRPWVSFRGDDIRRYSDEDMAKIDGWTIIPSKEDGAAPMAIRDPYDLKTFQSQYGMRDNWHEPDEQNIGARIIGTHLDNAMGSTIRYESTDWGGEFNVVLTRDVFDYETNQVERTDLAVVNLATLLSWAADYGDSQR